MAQWEQPETPSCIRGVGQGGHIHWALHGIVTHSRYTYSLHHDNVDAMSRRLSSDIRVRFGFVVKTLRETQNLTQEDLAERAKIHRTYLSDIERGSRNVALINIERLAQSLSVTMQELFRRVDKS